MKKLTAILMTIILITGIFAGCNEKQVANGTNEQNTPAGALKIGLVQLVEHPSLDEIRTAFTNEIQALAGTETIVEIDYKNAQGDISLINTICRGFVNDKVDVIVAIATPAAQGAAAATKDIPIIFSAVTDPVAAGLLTDINVPGGNITGVSDHIDVKQIFALAEELTPDVTSYGLIYNKGESNSVSVIGEVKAYLDEKNISYTEKTVGNSGEVQQAARVLFESNDAVFAPIDNTVASAMLTLTNESLAANKPVYVAADSMVADGGLATVGINYTLLGEKTAAMVMDVLSGKTIGEIPVEVMTDITPVVNEHTAEALGIDVSKYSK